ncbi:MAG TPA: hemerythrin domain-containing protein [Gallionellaceae bacterium]|nr:hemerythrin domain-containing protein [Gallionellaceae bacterium]
MSPEEIIKATSSTPDSVQEVLKTAIQAHQQALALLQQTERAYTRLIPHQLLKLLNIQSIVDIKLGDQVERKMTIMFADIRNFTPLSESMSPAENFEFINSYLSQMEPVISAHNGIIDKYMGDAIMALFSHGADDAMVAAIAMLKKLEDYNTGRKRAGYVPIDIGIGLNTGMVMIGTVGGAERMDSTVIGDPVNLTPRIEQATKVYHAPLLISQHTFYDLANPERYDIRFLDRIRVRGKTQPLSIYEVFDCDPDEVRKGKRATRAMFEEAVAYYHLQEIPRALELLKKCVEQVPQDISAVIYLTRCHDYMATGAHATTGELNNRLAWKETYNYGIAEIDNVHRDMFERISAFNAIVRNGDAQVVDELLTYLENHIRDYFQTEEELMKRYHYPFLDYHLQEHQRFARDIAAMRRDARSGKVDPLYLSFRLMLMMCDWFTGHFAKTDRHTTRYLLSRMATE